MPTSSKQQRPIKRSRTIDAIDTTTFKTGDGFIDAHIAGKNLDLAEINKLKDFITEYGKHHRLRSSFICKGSDCISAYNCPFLAIDRPDLLPLNKKCPIDMMMAEQYYNAMEKCITDSAGDNKPMDVFTEAYVRELTAIEVYVARMDDRIADDSDSGRDIFTSRRVSSINQRTGEAFYEDTPHFLLDAKLRLLDRRDRILKALLLTPESRARYKLDKVKSLADLMKEAQSAARVAVEEMKRKGVVNLDELKSKTMKKIGQIQTQASNI